ncbi:hypothetical protein FHS96_005001 [Sphingomonas zeicaulis]|uniref:hypothetical protein n=1 Tax=Sphingomonas zeicaulis TaxID=1632740 RepID=UPI003D1E99F9
MTEDERKELYWSLLKGLAKEAQDRMCAANRSHDWSNWHRSEIRHDEPLGYPKFISDPAELAREMNRPIRIRSDRYCYNCGKRETL